MRLLTYVDEQGSHIGALLDEQIVCLDAVAPSMLSLIDGGLAALEHARRLADRGDNVVLLPSVQVLAPIPRPRQNVICLGMNYVAHAYESERARGREPKLPQYPVFFTKAAQCVCAHDDDIPLDPSVTQQLDHEVELAFIMGRDALNVKRENAMEYVFGYTIINDITGRDLQNRHQQFFKGKSLNRSCPMGPVIVTADEIPDPKALQIQLRLNDVLRQDSKTDDLIFDIPTIIEYLSLGMTLEAGTVIATGTPEGVGMGRTPPDFLKAGDVLECEIEQIGLLRNRIVTA